LIISATVLARKYGKTPYIFFARSLDSNLLSELNVTIEDVTTELLWAIMMKNKRLALLKIYEVVSGILPQAKLVNAIQHDVKRTATLVMRSPRCCLDARIVSSLSCVKNPD
jgi:hypothetical protein